MKTSLTFKGLALGLVIATLVPAMALAGGGTFQSANALIFGTDTAVAGGATLIRHGNSIHLRVAMSGLDADSVYSAWYIIFNKPNKCADGPGNCGLVDIANPAVKAAVLNAGGFLTGNDSVGYFTGTLNTGRAPAGMCCFGNLKSGFSSEVHVLLQTHGPAVPGSVNGQLSIPGFECNAPADCGNADQFAFVFPATKGGHHSDSDSDSD